MQQLYTTATALMQTVGFVPVFRFLSALRQLIQSKPKAADITLPKLLEHFGHRHNETIITSILTPSIMSLLKACLPPQNGLTTIFDFFFFSWRE